MSGRRGEARHMRAWRRSSDRSRPRSSGIAQTARISTRGPPRPTLDATVQGDEAHELDARVHAQLAVDPRAVRLDGLDADEQLGRDALVRVAGDDEVEDLALARRQAAEQAVRLRVLVDLADQLGI